MTQLKQVSEKEYVDFVQTLNLQYFGEDVSPDNYCTTYWVKGSGRPWHESIVARSLPDITTSNHRQKVFYIHEVP
jgi:hypothetical protein